MISQIDLKRRGRSRRFLCHRYRWDRISLLYPDDTRTPLLPDPGYGPVSIYLWFAVSLRLSRSSLPLVWSPGSSPRSFVQYSERDRKRTRVRGMAMQGAVGARGGNSQLATMVAMDGSFARAPAPSDRDQTILSSSISYPFTFSVSFSFFSLLPRDSPFAGSETHLFSQPPIRRVSRGLSVF